ncbi:hypothetical protein Trydic_g16974 [Trypoxylus dichotomus]
MFAKPRRPTCSPQTVVHAWPGPIQSRNLSYQFLPVEPAKSPPFPHPSPLLDTAAVTVTIVVVVVDRTTTPSPFSATPSLHYRPRRMGRHLVPPAVILHVVVFV